MQHNISGQILAQEANCDCNKIIFIDTSTYQAEVDNPLLRICPPNWNKYVDVQFNVSAITVLEPKHIKHASFPDGAYHIIQSVCPNGKTEKSFCYFHTCCLKEQLNEKICDNLDNKEELEKLFEYKMNLDILNDIPVEEATTLYNNTKKQLNKMCDEC